MGNNKLHPIPSRDPVSGKPLIVSELTCEESGVTIRGRFEIPRYNVLDEEQAKFLETFLRCRGTFSAVEKELGISYPTVRSRLDALLQTLGLVPVREEEAAKRAAAKSLRQERNRIIDQLERGEISLEEAKAKLRGGAQK